MKTDLNGVSQCEKGCENYETFTNRKRKFVQYEYRAENGELFTTVKPTLAECRKAKNEFFKPTQIVVTPKDFAKMSSDEIVKYMRSNPNTAIIGYNTGVDRHIIFYRTKNDWFNYKNPFTNEIE